MINPDVTLLTATDASRRFASVLERARAGESFVVTKNGAPMAQIVPPSPPPPNGASVLAFLEAWEPDSEGFTDDIISALDQLTGPQDRDQERLAWVGDYS